MARTGHDPGPLIVQAVLDTARLAVPARIRVVGDGSAAQLHWSTDEGWRHSAPMAGCLEAFLRLASTDDPRVYLGFAERYGVLGLQAEGRFGDAHHPSDGLPPVLVDDGARWHAEPLTAWTLYARHGRALVLLAEALRRRVASLGPIDARAVLAGAGALTDVPVDTLPPDMVAVGSRYSVRSLVLNFDRCAGHGLEVQRVWLGNTLTWSWLNQATLVPRLDWSGAEPTLDVAVAPYMGGSDADGPWSPFALGSVLAGQLAAAITNAGRYAQCSHCGQLFMPAGRRARLDRRRFCSPACRLHGERQRKREHATRRRERERAGVSA